ncbi:hypothetical protein HYX17_01510 [Candidatus Woesearchaeota archaeon]|nr:hypothetical protein [Candidatus Woesearchaeota archaeon]
MLKISKLIVILFILIIPLALAEEIYLFVGDSVTHNGKIIRLENVGSGGAVVVNVGGVSETVPASNTEAINGIVISNLETYYEDNKEQRSALLDISTMNELCSNGKKDSINEENGVDCGGPYCSVCETCDDNIKNRNETDVDCGGLCEKCEEGEKCNSNNDCKSEDCYNGECKECKYFGKPFCKSEFIVELGEDKQGCFLGYICCGDNKCKEKEDKNNCPSDCNVCVDKDEDGYKAGDCNEDCDDNDPETHKSAKEICSDNKDNNCNDKIDEDCEEEEKEAENEVIEEKDDVNLDNKIEKGKEFEEIIVVAKENKDEEPKSFVYFVFKFIGGLFG